VLANREYEDTVVSNSTWSEGDWNNDHEFDSGDLVTALATGGYEPDVAIAAVVPEPTGAVLLIVGGLIVAPKRLRRTQVAGWSASRETRLQR
jgi:hypothetical protein